MNNSDKNARKCCIKALAPVKEIMERYPSGIEDVKTINEEKKAWMQSKIQQLHECLKPLKHLFSRTNWWESLRISRNKVAHLKEELKDDEFAKLCKDLFTHIPKIKSDLEDKIKSYKQRNKKKRKFENTASPESAFGSLDERRRIVDAMEDAVDPVEPKDERIEFPETKFAKVAKDTISELLNTDDIQQYLCEHDGMSENVQTDILEWMQKKQNELEKNNPFLEEEIFIAGQKKKNVKEIATDISSKTSKIEEEYKALPSIDDSKRGSIKTSSLDFGFYRKEFASQKEVVKSEEGGIEKQEKTKTNAVQMQVIQVKRKKLGIEIEDIEKQEKTKENVVQKQVITVQKGKWERKIEDIEKQEKTKTNAVQKQTIKWKNEEKLTALHRNFLMDMEKNLIDRKNNWEQEEIEESRKDFLKELYQKIDNFMKLEKLLSPFIKDFGRLWDMSTHIFETSGFEILETFANLLEQDESLQELANMLGKQNRAYEKFEKELRDKVVIKNEWHPEPAYRGAINGLKYSNDIASVLPTELAMLKNPATKKLFQLKFAQKQLLSFEFQTNIEKPKEEIESEEISVEKKEPKGPIIICVDTSGSMQGSPENIAKTVTFALSKIAVEEMRQCFVISFSTDIETLEVKPNEDMEMTSANDEHYLQKLVKFLRMSFNGGTDAEPALRKAIKMLNGEEGEGYKNADVLMISDFVMQELSEDLVSSIKKEKEKDTAFYSLVIGRSGNQNTIASFDHNWCYNTDDAYANRHLIEQLNELKRR